ncbi:MAG: helix-turn-helix transcriptional regulator [Clostridia bacterium]|nr:helix-turn-helix transcriptional regulator [Clostridia bacterium]
MSREYFLPYTDREPPQFGCHVSCIGYNAKSSMGITRCYQYRSDYQIIYVAKGRGRVQIEDTWYSYDSESLILYKPAIYQRYEIGTDLQQNREVYWLYFEKLPVEALTELFHIPEGSLYHVEKPERLKPVFDAILQSAGEDPENNILLSLYAGALLASIAGSVTPYPTRSSMLMPDTEGRIHMICREIEENYMMNVEIKEYASRVSLNRGYFIESFRRVTGYTPLAYRTRLRMLEAEKQLAETDKPIHEIAVEIGYMDSLYFSKLFRRHSGMTPGEYRKNCRNIQTVLPAES